MLLCISANYHQENGAPGLLLNLRVSCISKYFCEKHLMLAPEVGQVYKEPDRKISYRVKIKGFCKVKYANIMFIE